MITPRKISDAVKALANCKPDEKITLKVTDTVSPPLVDPDWFMVTNTYPSAVWADDVISPAIKMLVEDLDDGVRIQEGKVLDWTTLSITCVEDGDVVRVTAGAKVL